MDRNTVAKKVKKVVADVFNVSEKKLTEKTDFIDDLHAKSMEIVELLAALEMEFGFRIPQKDVRQNKTLKQAIDYMYKRAKK
jgi:acyl carrier protein